MHETDIKIFELIDMLKFVKAIKYDSKFCESIGLLKQNLILIKQGKKHFTINHIKNVCEVYNVNSNWIFNIETNVYRVKPLTFKNNSALTQKPTYKNNSSNNSIVSLNK